MKIKNKKYKKRYRVRNVVFIISGLLFTLSLIYLYSSYKSVKNSFSNKTVNNDEVIMKSNYLYRDNPTSLQKELYDELDKTFSSNSASEEEKAIIVVKNFIADFYTWTNKAGSYDVGGVTYLHSPTRFNLAAQGRKNFYKYLSYYIREYGSENLIEVSKVDAKVVATDVADYEGKRYFPYVVKASWEYKPGSKIDTTNFKKDATFQVIVNEEGRYEIVLSWE